MRFPLCHYQVGDPPVAGWGLGADASELEVGLAASVVPIISDDAGTEQLENLLGSLPETDFERANLRALLDDSRTPEDWRVGEAIAESFLVENRECQFPWPDGRDERRSGSSLPGADLVGFRGEGPGVRFAFGEVKTSSESTCPPGVVYGRHGLQSQLEDLRDHRPTRDTLVKYLGHRATRCDWGGNYQTAARAFLGNSCDVHLFGVLIRDVAPSENDLRARVNALATDCPPVTVIELYALYLPVGSIATLGTRVAGFRQEGGAS